MAIAFIRGNAISRQKGQSVVASAAYRACEKLHDERHCRDPDYKDPDYRSKSGHLAGGLVLPEKVKWTREELWNAVEAYEKRIDARLAKELIIAMPKELSVDENIALSKEIAILVSTELHPDGTKDEYCVDWHLHGPHSEAVCDEEGNFILDKDGKKIIENNDNFHTHILMTERAWDSGLGTFKKLKDRNRNSKEWMSEIKLKIGTLMNQRLREKGIPEVDFRSFDVRNAEALEKTGKELEAPQEHKGPIKTNMDRKRKRRINRIKRELKMVEDELRRIEMKENQKIRSKNNNSMKPRNKVDLSDWNSGDESIVATKKSNSREGGKRTIVPITSRTKPIEKPRTKSVPVKPILTSPIPVPSPKKKVTSNQNQGPEVRCLFCGFFEYPECKKCRFREESNEISNDSGYSM